MFSGEVKQHLPSWKESSEFCHKLLTLLNSYQPGEIRHYAIEALRELILNYQTDCVNFMTPLLLQGHTQFQDQNLPSENTQIHSLFPSLDTYNTNTLMMVYVCLQFQQARSFQSEARSPEEVK